MNIDFFINLLKKFMEELVKKIIEDTVKKKPDTSQRNNNTQPPTNIGRPYTLFAPAYSLKQERADRDSKMSAEYRKNNHGKHKAKGDIPYKIDGVTQATYDNYKSSNHLLKEVTEEREKRILNHSRRL